MFLDIEEEDSKAPEPQDNDPEEEHEEPEEEEEEEIVPQRTGKRGRPPGSKNRNSLIKEGSKPTKGRRSTRSTEELSDHEATENFVDNSGSQQAAPARRGRGRGGRWATRGRGAKSLSLSSSGIPLDANGKPFEVVDDELLLPEDPAGETKVTKDGELLGGREYRVRTFTVSGRGNKLYMLSTEPARCMGFRDSYLLFQKHRRLYKLIVTEEEKFNLIEREVIPHSYKGRAIGIVTARSVYLEFGSRIVVGGKRVIDDYYEEEAKKLGFEPGQLADPDDKLPPPGVPYNKNQYVAWHGASSVYHQYAQAQPSREVFKDNIHKRKKIVVTDENWMLEHANAASQYNHEILLRRKQTVGVYEPHTGVRFYPAITQPTRAELVHVSRTIDYIEEDPSSNKKTSNPRIVIETVLETPNNAKLLGLKNVPPHIFESASPEVKEAILKQQELERQWE